MQKTEVSVTFSCIYPGFRQKKNGQCLFDRGVYLSFSVGVYLKHNSLYNCYLEVKEHIAVSNVVN